MNCSLSVWGGLLREYKNLIFSYNLMIDMGSLINYLRHLWMSFKQHLVTSGQNRYSSLTGGIIKWPIIKRTTSHVYFTFYGHQW